MNLASIVEPHAGSRVAFSYKEESLSYGELRQRAGALRSYLTGRSLEPGERVGIVLGATPAFAVSYLAVLGAGAVAVPLNPNSPLEELRGELAAVGGRRVVTGAGQVSHPGGGDLMEELTELGHETIALAADGSLLEGRAGPPAEPPLVERDAEDPAVLLFTSGTAGSPRPAVLTHGNLLSNIEQVEMRVGLAATAEDVGLLAVPPFHILGLNAVLGVQLYAGGRTVLLERFAPAELLRVVAKEKVTILVGVPQLFAALAAAEEARGDELSSVRLACSGAAPLPRETAACFKERFGVLFQGYGLTEASPTVAFPDLAAPCDPASVGVPLPGVEVRLVDEDGEEVEVGDPGEILVRGPNVFAGYFEDPEATRAALRRGWLHTGDLGVMSPAGTLSIVDRQKDIVIVSGFNVYPGEVEEVLESHPAVAAAAVVGAPDAETGEAVRAFVVPSPGLWEEGAALPAGVGAEELVEHCAGRLASYKCPRQISFVRELPRGPQGKVLRREVG